MARENAALRSELFALLIRLTNSESGSGGRGGGGDASTTTSLQAWKLLALALPLYAPRQYAILWLLQAHLRRAAAAG